MNRYIKFLLVLIVFPVLGFSQEVTYEYNKTATAKKVVNQIETVVGDTIPTPDMANKSQSIGTQLPNPNTLQLPDANKVVPEVMTKDEGGNLTTVNSPAPIASFQALGDNNAQTPPDTHGAAGPNHLMTTLNTEIRIQNKTGTTLSTQSLSSFWSGFSFTTIFDPRIHYDPYAGRWIFTVCIDKSVATSSILVAVSATNDPTGAWYQWQVDADAGNTTWADYPTVGFNNKWIVVSCNMFNNVGNGWAGPQLFVFSKTDLYGNGTGTSTSIYPGTSVGGTYAPAVTYDNSVNSVFLVQDYNGNSSGWGYLGLSKIYGPVATPLFSLHYSFPATFNTWNWSPGGADFAPQLGSAQKVQHNDSKMQNVVYRNGSLWCAHHIFLPVTSSTHTAVQWWELDTTGTIAQRARIEDTGASTFYAFPSIAVNASDDVLIGYSSFSATQYISGEYSYRQGTDALNTMRTSHQYKTGTAPYYKTHSGTKNRWGDYSATIVDPSNDDDFWTIQESAANQVAGIDRWSTDWAKVQCTIPLSTFNASTLTTSVSTPITITANETNTSTIFNWNFAGGVATPGTGQGPHNVSWSSAGAKMVTLSTTLNGCNAGQTSQLITVNDPASIDPIIQGDIVLYPNPFDGYFTINYEGELDQMIIYTSSGQQILIENNLNSGDKIDLDLYPEGLYLIRIIKEDKIYDFKMIKK